MLQSVVVLVALVAKWCPTLADHMDGSLPGSSVHGVSQQEYWSRLPFSSSGDLPDTGIKPESPKLAGKFFTTVPPGKSSTLSCFIAEIGLI